MKGNANKRNKFLIIGVLCLAIACLATYAFSMKKEQGTPANPVKDLTSDSTMIYIDTPYHVFEFPLMWEDYLQCFENISTRSYSVTFYCCIEETKTELFTLFFNQPDTGELYGYFTTNEGEISFSINVPKEDPQLNDKEKKVFYGMAEEINSIIHSVNKADNFQSLSAN